MKKNRIKNMLYLLPTLSIYHLTQFACTKIFDILQIFTLYFSSDFNTNKQAKQLITL